MAIESVISWAIKVTNDGDNAENIGGNSVHEFDRKLNWPDGTTVNKADLCWSDRRTLSASANEMLDLAGVLTDEFGNTVTMAKIKLLFIRNRNTTDGDDLNVGPDATNGWTGFWANDSDRSVVAADGIFFQTDPNGIAVGAGASDELYIEEVGGANAVDYDILVIGTSA